MQPPVRPGVASATASSSAAGLAAGNRSTGFCRRRSGQFASPRPGRFVLRPFDVQFAGGVVMHFRALAELATGEGKTLDGFASPPSSTRCPARVPT